MMRPAALLLTTLFLGGAWIAPGIPVPQTSTPRVAVTLAQETPCSGAAFDAFDFWVGEWVVRNADGEEVGRNRILRVSDGCAILESWTSAEGSTGTSLNFYDPSEGRWVQVWVGGGGARLHLEGGLEDGAMVLQGERVAEGERIRDRITWTPLDDGTVRQTWDIARGGGEWEKSWEGFYHPAGGG